MLSPALIAYLGFACLVVSPVALYEHRLYTAAQRRQAAALFWLHLSLWFVVFGIGVVSLGLLAVGDTHLLSDYGFLLGIVPFCINILRRHLYQKLGLDQSPLARRFDDWWSHPSDQ
ncbi:hypothetical protein ACFQJ7_06460 [Halovenus rubra]|uniref:DUF4870 domain-containing protein n=2 Tax=Halovenus rubra TaxID=869890 RepID=A0ABD5X939_9EURY|nr:hypothetical protein [Halovenus rubra]